MSEFNKFRWQELAVRMVKDTPVRVAAEMFNRADMDGSRVFINNEKLAQELGCSTKSVERATRQLVKIGLARRERRGHNLNGAKRTSSEYTLTMPTQADIAPSTGHGVNRTSVSSQPDIHVEPTGHRSPTNRLVTRFGNRTESGIESEPDISEMSGQVSPPVEEKPEGTNQPSGAASNTSTESEEEMKSDPFDPWENATVCSDPFAPQSRTFRSANVIRAYVAPEFKMPANAFVGPETDPATGGPNWSQGPRQRPA